MQNQERTGFEPVPDEIAAKLPKIMEHERAKEILRECPRPTLFVGEVVTVKGMSFRVTRIKADGKVGLRMVP